MQALAWRLGIVSWNVERCQNDVIVYEWFEMQDFRNHFLRIVLTRVMTSRNGKACQKCWFLLSLLCIADKKQILFSFCRISSVWLKRLVTWNYIKKSSIFWRYFWTLVYPGVPVDLPVVRGLVENDGGTHCNEHAQHSPPPPTLRRRRQTDDVRWERREDTQRRLITFATITSRHCQGTGKKKHANVDEDVFKIVN